MWLGEFLALAHDPRIRKSPWNKDFVATSLRDPVHSTDEQMTKQNVESYSSWNEIICACSATSGPSSSSLFFASSYQRGIGSSSQMLLEAMRRCAISVSRIAESTLRRGYCKDYQHFCPLRQSFFIFLGVGGVGEQSYALFKTTSALRLTLHWK